MNLTTSTFIVIPRAPQDVFHHACANETLMRCLQPKGPIAGVEKIEMFEGEELAAGSRRRVWLTDGTELEEVILDYEPLSKHRYRWTGGIKPPFSFLVRSGTGCWDFSEVEGGTRIDWAYVLELTSPLASPLALPVVWLFKGWMAQGLEAIRAELVD